MRCSGIVLACLVAGLGCARYNPVVQVMPYETRVRGDRESLACTEVALLELGFEFYDGDVDSGWLQGVKEGHYTPSPGYANAHEHVRLEIVDRDGAGFLELRYGVSRYQDRVDPEEHPQADLFFARPPARNLDLLKEAVATCQRSVFEGNQK